ncbi:MAG TPA: hypothetical protein VN924_24995 [Bryobacteraceae bacterium]|nr:hypothetical protein [Bryobacteraceae bacterium]
MFNWAGRGPKSPQQFPIVPQFGFSQKQNTAVLRHGIPDALDSSRRLRPDPCSTIARVVMRAGLFHSAFNDSGTPSAILSKKEKKCGVVRVSIRKASRSTQIPSRNHSYNRAEDTMAVIVSVA